MARDEFLKSLLANEHYKSIDYNKNAFFATPRSVEAENILSKDDMHTIETFLQRYDEDTANMVLNSVFKYLAKLDNAERGATLLLKMPRK